MAGNELWSQNVGTQDHEGATFDGRYFYSIRSDVGTIRLKQWLTNGAGVTLVRIQNIGVTAPSSLTYDGYGFWVTAGVTRDFRYIDHDGDTRFATTGGAAGTWKGIATDGNNLFLAD
jgi:hypothetical protein